MIIDYVDLLELTDEQVQARANELNSLAYLSQGLHFLHAQVKRTEEKIRAQIGSKRKLSFFLGPPEFEWLPQGLVACAFHWYAVSACNYARMVGWLAYGDKEKAGGYVRRVLPSENVWRNKVAAHFANASPKPETAADLVASVIFPIGFHHTAFYTSWFRVGIVLGGQKTTGRRDMTWSLTDTHRRLCDRYWPDELLNGSARL